MNFYKAIVRHIVSRGLATQVIISNMNGETWYYPKKYLYINIKILKEIMRYHSRTFSRGQKYRYLELQIRSSKIIALPLDAGSILIALMPPHVRSIDFLSELRIERILSREKRVH